MALGHLGPRATSSLEGHFCTFALEVHRHVKDNWALGHLKPLEIYAFETFKALDSTLFRRLAIARVAKYIIGSFLIKWDFISSLDYGELNKGESLS